MPNSTRPLVLVVDDDADTRELFDSPSTWADIERSTRRPSRTPYG